MKMSLFSSNLKVPKIYSYTRFSSEKQRHGDSVRRQIEAAEIWSRTEGNGLELDTSLRDEGISGFYGRNAEVGALGTFLNAIRTGQVASGSVLLVENLDRISRNDPLKAMHILETVVEAGVDVVTLQDRRRYTRENISQDVSHLIIALITFARGNEESRTKSKRLCAMWSNKRREAAQTGKVMSTWVHPWIRVEGIKRIGLKADYSAARYVLIADRAATVRRIFKWAVAGWGYGRIAQELKGRGVKPWGRAGWSITRISKVIKNRAVLGEYQPHRYEGGAHGKRVPDGPPIAGYYPRVISDSEFRAAQPEPGSMPRGRPQTRVRLLSGFLVDPRDRPMYAHAKAKGAYPTYYTASNRLEYGERPFRWSAEHLERCVVAACRDIDWSCLYGTESIAEDQLEAQIRTLGQESKDINSKIANAAKQLLEGALGEAVKAEVKNLEARLAAIQLERTASQNHLVKLRRANAIAPKFSAHEVPASAEQRASLRAELRTVLSKVQVWPDGRTPDSFWKAPLLYAKEAAPALAKLSIATGAVMGAFRMFFRNERAITAYVTFVRAGKNRAAKVIAFANPEGMTLEEWDKICSFAGMYGDDAESGPRAPNKRRAT
jgi:DNA invertase Pin-like site-specific DNA recombinase